MPWWKVILSSTFLEKASSSLAFGWSLWKQNAGLDRALSAPVGLLHFCVEIEPGSQAGGVFFHFCSLGFPRIQLLILSTLVGLISAPRQMHSTPVWQIVPLIMPEASLSTYTHHIFWVRYVYWGEHWLLFFVLDPVSLNCKIGVLALKVNQVW